MLTPPAVADLAQSSGRPVESYSAFATEALLQATIIFQFATCLTSYPDPDTDTLKYNLAIKGITELADRLYLEQPFDADSASPFVSENIGSYSYSKASRGKLLSAVTYGDPTGIYMFDMAVSKLSVCTDTGRLGASGGIEVFEREHVRINPVTGGLKYYGPKDLQPFPFELEQQGGQFVNGFPQEIPTDEFLEWEQ